MYKKHVITIQQIMHETIIFGNKALLSTHPGILRPRILSPEILIPANLSPPDLTDEDCRLLIQKSYNIWGYKKGGKYHCFDFIKKKYVST